MFRYHAFTACLLIVLIKPAFADHPSLNLGVNRAGPIITDQAATMPQGSLALSLSSEYIQSDAFSDDELATMAGQHIHGHSADWVLTSWLGTSYGLTDSLTLGLRLPFVHRDNLRTGHHAHGGGGAVNTAEELGDSTGFGDIALTGKYRFWDEGNTQAAVIFGVKAPTGRTNVSHDGERLEVEHQPGSGSWDGLIGFAAGTKAGPVSLDASALYAVATEGAQQTDHGDRLQYNLAMSYRVGGEIHHHHGKKHLHKALDLVLEMNGEWSGKRKADGDIDDDSGGNTIYVSPGVRFSPAQTWSAHLSVGVPVVSNIGDGHAETDYKILAGIVRPF